MKVTSRIAGTLAVSLAFFSGPSPQALHAAALRGAAAGAARGPGIAPVSATPAVLSNPAAGGTFISAPTAARAPLAAPRAGVSAAPSASISLPAASVPSAAAPAPRVWAGAAPRTPARRAAAASTNRGLPPRSVLEAARGFAAGLSAPGVGGAARAAQSRRAFDGAGARGSAAGSEPVVANRQGMRGGELRNISADGRDLSALQPRVVFIQDVFSQPASPALVDYINKLVDAGVHVVFLTWRPHKGTGSAEEVLLGRQGTDGKGIKMSPVNPVIVVSHNGGKIAKHSRAKNPPSVIPDAGHFLKEHLERFAEIGADVQAALKTPALAEERVPDTDTPFAYQLRIPKSVKNADLPRERTRILAAYNHRIEKAGLPFRLEAHPDDPRLLTTQSMPLRFSQARIFQALEAAFPGDSLAQERGRHLILADSKKSPKFSRTFLTGRAEIQVVQSADQLQAVLGAVLGDRALPTVNIKLGMLRQFLEYWEPSLRWRSRGPGAAGGQGGSGGSSSGQARHPDNKFPLYIGSVIWRLLQNLYEDIWRGQNDITSLKQVERTFVRMWRAPQKYQMFVSKEMAAFMKSAFWRQNQKRYMARGLGYIRRFWGYEFEDYAMRADYVEDNYVAAAKNRKSLITLYFSSPATGRLYKIFTRIAHVFKTETPEGRVLTGVAYRTGMPPKGNGEEMYARVVAMAVLVGHGRKGPDGKWHHGSPDGKVIGKVEVKFHYGDSERLWRFEPNDILALEPYRADLPSSEWKKLIRREYDMYAEEDFDENGGLRKTESFEAYAGRNHGIRFQITQGPLVQDLTSAMERMMADQEFVAEWEKEQTAATKDDLKRKPAKARAKKKSSGGKAAAGAARKKKAGGR